VVSKVEQDNGIGGFSSNTYQYEGLKFHQQGLGSLGFSKRTITSQVTGIRTFEYYTQDIASHKIGLPTLTQVAAQNGVLLKESQQTWQPVPR
ncbi:hypothetical protein H0A36_31075, partial [Endozoicomonas sp. SM1973]